MSALADYIVTAAAKRISTCSRCAGSGMTIGDDGDPRICPQCKGDTVEPPAAKRRACASCGEDQAELRLLDFNGWVPNEAWCGECFGTPEELEFKDLPLVQEGAK